MDTARKMVGVFGLFSVVIFIVAVLRMNSCGYDCGFFSVTHGPRVIVVLAFSIASFGLLLLVAVGLFALRQHLARAQLGIQADAASPRRLT